MRSPLSRAFGLAFVGLLLLVATISCSPEAGGAEPVASGSPVVREVVRKVTHVEGKHVELPTSLDDLLDRADIVAVGTIGEVVREVVEGAFSESADTTVDSTKVPYTYFQLELTEVIKDDGTVAAKDPVLLRVSGSSNDGPVQIGEGHFMEFSRSYPMPKPGERRLFVLSRYPNGSYSSIGARGLLDIGGDTIKFATHEGHAVPFAVGKTSDEFLADVRKKVSGLQGN